MATASDPRFGLPLSLVEALRRDTSPKAAELADLIEQEPPPLRRRAGAAMAACLALAAGAGLAGHACSADAGSMVGRWVMAPQASTFHEDLTGAAPDKVVVVVTRDDAQRFDYRVEELREGAPVARASYAVSYAGPSTSRSGGAVLQVSGARAENGDVVIRAPRVDGLQAVIRMHRDGPAAATLEHAVEGPEGAATLEHLVLAREAMASAD